MCCDRNNDQHSDVTSFIGLAVLISPSIISTIHTGYILAYKAVKGSAVITIKVYELNESLTIHPQNT